MEKPIRLVRQNKMGTYSLHDEAYKRLIIAHHKNLLRGDYLIDDREKNGAKEFEGELILFGSEKFPDWRSVLKYLLPNKN